MDAIMLGNADACSTLRSCLCLLSRGLREAATIQMTQVAARLASNSSRGAHLRYARHQGPEAVLPVPALSQMPLMRSYHSNGKDTAMGQDGSGCRGTGHKERRREEPTGWKGRRREREEEGQFSKCSIGPAFPFWRNLRS